MSLLAWLPTRGTLPELPTLAELAAARGTPVVFLHGLLGSPANFERPLKALLARDVPVAAPAYGVRGTAPVEDSFEELTGVLARLRAVSPTGRIDVVGHSLGGHLGLRLAHHFPPGAVRTLVGVGAAFRGIPYHGRPWFRHAAGAVTGPGVVDVLRPEPWDAHVPEGTRVVSIISRADRVVPPQSADLGEVVHIDGVMHEKLPQAADAILDALAWRP